MLGSPKKIVLHSWSNFCVSESSNNIPSLRTFNILFRLLRDFQAQIRFSRNLLGIRPAIMAFLSFASLFYQLKVLILVFQSLHNKFLRISKVRRKLFEILNGCLIFTEICFCICSANLGFLNLLPICNHSENLIETIIDRPHNCMKSVKIRKRFWILRIWILFTQCKTIYSNITTNLL